MIDAPAEEYLKLYHYLCVYCTAERRDPVNMPMKPLLNSMVGFRVWCDTNYPWPAGGPLPELRKIFIDHAYTQCTGLGIKVQLLLERADGVTHS